MIHESIYFVAVIAAGGRDDWNELTGTDGVWLETTNGYQTIPRDVTELDSHWIKEACIAEMGEFRIHSQILGTSNRIP